MNKEDEAYSLDMKKLELEMKQSTCAHPSAFKDGASWRCWCCGLDVTKEYIWK